MYIITKTDPDELMFDILSEYDGRPILFSSVPAAKNYIEKICVGYGIPLDNYMVSDNIEICSIH